MSTATIAERVRRGAMLLDCEVPGWAAKINEDELDLGSCFGCILGQIYGNYLAGVEGLLGGFKGDYDDRPTQHGFERAIDYAYDPLAELWLAEIRTRLAPPVPTVDPLHVAAVMNVPEMVP